MEQHTSYSSSRLSPASITSAADTETAINFQLPLCPVEHDDHLEHGMASMVNWLILYCVSSTIYLWFPPYSLIKFCLDLKINIWNTVWLLIGYSAYEKLADVL